VHLRPGPDRPQTRLTGPTGCRHTAGQRTLEERLQAARSNNRFLDKRIAGPEAQLLAAKPRT